MSHRIGGGKLALVSREDASYGVLRMYEAFSDLHERRVRVFRDRSSAMKWLDEPEEAGAEDSQPESSA